MMDRASEQPFFLRVARYRAGGATTPRALLAQAIDFIAKIAASAVRSVPTPALKTPFRFMRKGLNGIHPTVSIAGPVPADVLRKQSNLSAKP